MDPGFFNIKILVLTPKQLNCFNDRTIYQPSKYNKTTNTDKYESIIFIYTTSAREYQVFFK